MEVILDNLSIITPFFAVSWALFLIAVLRRPQRMTNCYLLMAALFFSAVMLTGIFGDYMGYALLALFILIMAALLLVPAMLIFNGVRLLKKEGFSAAHVLSLLLGIVIGTGEISAAAWLLTSMYNIDMSSLEVIMGFVFATVFYFSVVILSFVVYVLFIQLMPHRMDFDYVIIHGAGLIDGSRISKLLAERLDKAVEIYGRCKTKPILIPSGGKGADESVSEAEAMTAYLIDKGIPAESIVPEVRSSTTMENLRFSKELIESRGGAKRIALVSSNYHIYRCIVYASKLKMKCTGIGAKVALYYWPSAVLREFVAIYTMKKQLILILAGYIFFVIAPTLAILAN